MDTRTNRQNAMRIVNRLDTRMGDITKEMETFVAAFRLTGNNVVADVMTQWIEALNEIKSDYKEPIAILDQTITMAEAERRAKSAPAGGKEGE